MKKIISLFQRNYDGDRLVRNEIVPGAEWVVEGEGVATRKYDGTCCMIREGKLFKRYDAKRGKTPPQGFEPTQPEPDPVSGHWPGWLPVGDGPEDRWHREGLESLIAAAEYPEEARQVLETGNVDGTFELCGPKVQGNPEGFNKHYLVPHGVEALNSVPRDFEGIKAYLQNADIEGIVWHHPDGRMVKIKAKDFGIKRVG